MANFITHLRESGIPMAVEEINSAGTEEQENARFLLEELLSQKAYRTLELTQAERDRLLASTTAIDFPSGVNGVPAIKKQLKLSLRRLKRERAPISSVPKHGRSRLTLRYDHKKKITPSKIFENPISLSGLTTNQRSVVENKASAIVERAPQEPLDRLEHLKKFCAGVLDPNGVRMCARCGTPIEEAAPSWCVVLRITQTCPGDIESIQPLDVFCENCDGRPSEAPRKDEWWTVNLSSEEFTAYNLRQQGLTQAEIGNQFLLKSPSLKLVEYLNMSRISSKQLVPKGCAAPGAHKMHKIP